MTVFDRTSGNVTEDQLDGGVTYYYRIRTAGDA